MRKAAARSELLKFLHAATVGIALGASPLSGSSAERTNGQQDAQPLVLPGINQNHLLDEAVPGASEPSPLLQSAAALKSCANPVACENQLPGTARSVWSVQEPGDQSIIGFATELSVDVGQTVRFKIT